MATKLFVGGISWDTTDESLKNFFSQVGSVVSASVITDRETGRSKGFGFVEMSSEQEAKDAIQKLNGQSLDGRNIAVTEARPQEPRNRSFSGGENRSFGRRDSFGGGGDFGGGRRDFGGRRDDRRGGGNRSSRGRRSY